MNPEMIKTLHNLAESFVIAYVGEVDAIPSASVNKAVILKFPDLSQEELVDAASEVWGFIYDLAKNLDKEHYRGI